MYLFNFNLHIQISWMNFKFKLAKMPFGLHFSPKSFFLVPPECHINPLKYILECGFTWPVILSNTQQGIQFALFKWAIFNETLFLAPTLTPAPPYIRMHIPEWQTQSNSTNAIIIANSYVLLQRIAIIYIYITQYTFINVVL